MKRDHSCSSAVMLFLSVLVCLSQLGIVPDTEAQQRVQLRLTGRSDSWKPVAGETLRPYSVMDGRQDRGCIVGESRM